MRIVSWNIRAGGGKRRDGILRQLLKWQPDVIALGEFRGTPASKSLADELAANGFLHQFDSVNPDKLAMNALLTASKHPLEKLNIAHAPTVPCRWLAVRVHCDKPFILANVHIPNYTSNLKIPYYKATLKMMDEWDLGAAILVGDTNSGKAYIDDTTGLLWKNEHQWMEAVESRNWADALRHLDGDKRVYSWYSHKDNGFRLDQAFANSEMTPALEKIEYVWAVNENEPERRDGLSDHAAIVLDLDDQKGW